VKRSYLTLGFCWLLATGVCHGGERIEIVLDTSMEMWNPYQSGPPRIIAARSAINDFVVSPTVRAMQLEIGLRTIGGNSDIVEDYGCTDSVPVVNGGPVDPATWSAALDHLDPRGGRALVHAIEEAAIALLDHEGDRRIVVITSGDDQCRRDIDVLLKKLSQAKNPIPVRILGLEIDHGLATSLILSTPTRNVTDPATLVEFLRWAMLPPGAILARPEWLELRVSYGGQPVNRATVHLASPFAGEESNAAIAEGSARIRVAPGRYWGRIEGPEIGSIELADIVHPGNDEVVEINLFEAPEVTLEVNPDRPLAGAEAYIQYWGASPGNNRVAVAVAGTPAGQFLVQSPALEPTGEVALPLPDYPYDLEIQMTRNIGTGVQQLLGRVAFETARRRVSIEAPEKVENGTQVELGWSGDGLPGDHITIVTEGSDIADSLLCIPAVGQGPIAASAPAVAGEYLVRYLSRRGRMLARASLEVFEILATLEGPMTAAPGADISVSWTGPDSEQDFLSIAAHDELDEQYRSFSPTASGNPVILTAPVTAGDYEVRYVRAADSEVLARRTLVVAAVEVTLEVPLVVEAGTRFEVAWSGTAGEGDFITVADVRSGPKKHLDWSYTDLGSPVTLAAPFEEGKYVVRYISGASDAILAHRPIEVR